MGLLENRFNDSVVVEKLDKLLSWSRSTSPWFFQFGTACCAIEMMAAAASRHDLMRIGIIPRSSPRQADVMIVAGTVTMKMALRVKKLYEQMADPKYVVAMGSCATSGGPYWQHGYHVLKGVDIVIPVDVYVPGCPPRPEALIEGLLKLTRTDFGRKASYKENRLSDEKQKLIDEAVEKALAGDEEAINNIEDRVTRAKAKAALVKAKRQGAVPEKVSPNDEKDMMMINQWVKIK